jgi:acyl-CoA thioester hydrolase
MEKFSKEIKIKDEDIDILGHVNNIVYLKWVQDLAISHWEELSTDIQKDNLLWVVSKHEIDYKRATYKDDEVIGTTWVGEANKIYFERFTQFHRKKDNKLLSSVLTLWTPIDKQSKKRVRVDEDVYSLFSR